MRAAEDYRISIYNEISGLSSPILTGGSAADGRPPSYSSRRSTGTDPLGSKIKIAYDIQPKEEVVVLDHHEGILALDCEKANTFPAGLLELRVASASAFLANLPEDALFSIGPGESIHANFAVFILKKPRLNQSFLCLSFVIFFFHPFVYRLGM
jgi:hypothetical protein